MPENEKQPDSAAEDNQHDTREEYRSLSTDIAALAMPVAVVTAPVVNAWAKQHFAQEDKQDPPPQQQPKTD